MGDPSEDATTVDLARCEDAHDQEGLQEGELVKKHLSYANVAATLALAIAVAGVPTAIAVTVNTTKSSDVNKKGNIRAARVTTTKLADGAITGGKIGPIDIVQATDSSGTARANCPPGERLLSGGAHPSAGGSYPFSDSAWFGSAGSVTTVTVYAVCLKG
jgi:hypothetical protein